MDIDRHAFTVYTLTMKTTLPCNSMDMFDMFLMDMMSMSRRAWAAKREA